MAGLTGVADDAPPDCAYCATLSVAQWAWEFLRRHPGYQADYARFIAVWRELEAAYGAPPNRDFVRWQADARAYAPLPGEPASPGQGSGQTTGVACAGDDDRVLIECAMGAKWGFYKFPLAPDVIAPSPQQLTWRPPPPVDANAPDDAYCLDARFDLRLPLAAQLDRVRQRLASRVADLRRHGHAVPHTAENQRERWTNWLRGLDGVSVLPATEAAAAHACRDGGYRELLRLAAEDPGQMD
jgi:hypothetical protein